MLLKSCQPVLVTEVNQCEDGFEVVVEDGTRHYARKLLVSSGMTDELPPIEGFSGLWGRGVYHCPYCDGWEVRDLPLAVYGKGEDAFRRTKLLTAWTKTVALYSDGPAELSQTQRELLRRAGINICEEKIQWLEGKNRLERIVFEGGRKVECNGLFARPIQRQHSALVQSLGQGLDDNHLVPVSAGGRTAVPGLFVAGDSVALAQQVVLAAASGATAAIHINEELVTDTFNSLK